MRTRKNWLRTTIAMITLIATVIETGFSSVATYAAVLDNEDSILVSDDAQDSLITETGSSEDDVLTETGEEEDISPVTEIDISAPSDEVDISAPAKESESAEETSEGETKKAKLDVTDNGIIGSGYDSITIYIDTKNLDKNDKFRVKFVGADSAEYNPVLNDELDKTNSGRYTFENLAGDGFSVRATSTDNVILSYNYNENGDPVIAVASKSVDKTLTTKILTAVDDSKISAITGEGLEAVTVKFDTENLSDKSTFALYVETEAPAVVDGQDATKGITGLSSGTGSVTVEGLNKKNFIAYVVSDQEDKKISSASSIEDIENGVAVITVDNVDTKRVYEYEDSKIIVTAILQKADSIPDDAYFAVTPLTDEEAKAYLDALNASLEEGRDEVTAEDILLYDIAFYTDETKTEEIEPEEGSVSISIEFKKGQMTEELGVEDGEDVQVTHFVEDGKIIEPVEVDAKASTYEEKVDFTVDSFSVYGIWATTMANVKAGKTVSYADVLGEAVNYGIVANEMTLAGHMESNFAVSKMHGSAQIQSNKNNGGGAGRVYIGEYDDNSHGFIMDLNGNSGVLQIVTTDDVANRFDPCMKTRSGVFIDTKSMTKDMIQKKVSGMLTAVTDTSDTLMKEINCYQYASIQKNGCVDFTSKPAGTYYISFDTSDNNTANKFPGSNYEIRINGDQNVVLNIPDEKVSFGQYRLYIDGVQRVPQGNSDEEVLFEKLIFNCPNATWAETNGPVTGTFLLPRADFYNNSVAAGFLVANNIKRIGGSEWHCISRNIEIVEDDTTKLDIGVTKIFKDAAGNIVDDGLWPDEGFTFKIKKYTCNDPGDVNGSEVLRDVNKIPNLKDAKETVTIYKDTPGHTASFGYFEFKGKELYENNKNAQFSGSYPNTKYICFMYKIEEVKGTDPAIQYSATPRYIKVFVNSQKIVNGNHTKYYVWTETKVNDNVLYYTCKPDLIEIVNTYCPPDVPVDLEGIKKVNGQTDIVPDDTFTFKLYKYNKNTNGFDTTPIQTKKNKSISIKFDTMKLKFDEAPFFSNAAGANKSKQAYYYFLIKEDPCQKPYVYDKSVFVAKVILDKDYNNNKINSSVEYYQFADEKSIKLNELIGGQTKCFEFKATDLEFNNTYKAEGNTDFFGQKILENRKFQDGDIFTFTLTPKEVDGVIDNHNGAQEITIQPKKENNYEYDFKFNPLTYTYEDAGKDYTYTLAETKGNDNNIAYSKQTYDVVVSVRDNKDGTLSVTHNKATESNPASFTNRYAEGKVWFYATKVYGDGPLAADKEFTFELAGDGITTQTKSVIGPKTVKFDEIKYEGLSKVGTYHYTINEVLPKGATKENNYTVDGVIYDPRTYNITVVVTDDGSGELHKDITGEYDTGETIDDVTNPSFINDYAYSEVKEPIGGNKVLHGKELERGEFTFLLEAGNDTTKQAVKDGYVVLPETKVQNGIPEDKISDKNEFRFGEITFKKDGTYNFLITEVEPKEEDKEEGVVYSTQQYSVNIVVKDDGKGKLYIASRDKLDSDIIFINHKNGDGEVPLFAKKELKGRKLEKDQFTFALIDAKGNVIEAKNDESGMVAFTPLTYVNHTPSLSLDKPGDFATFDYVIKEVIPKTVPEGYTYDSHEEKVRVKVTLKADGSLDAEADNATLVIPAVFNNEYNAKGETTIDGIKEITGREYYDEDANNFFADIYGEDGKLVERVPITKDTRIFGEHGAEFKFSPLKFTQDDLKTPDGKGYYKQIQRKYTVKEFGEAQGVTMDDTIYEVLVTVSDPGKGTLNVTKEYTYIINNQKVDDIAFTNKFEANGLAAVVARKTVSGNVIKPGQFKFELKTEDESSTIATATNGDGGVIIFDGKDIKSLQYDQDDAGKTFTYKLAEQYTDMDGYTLDSRVYTVKISVSLENNTIKTVTKYYNEQGVEVPEGNVIFNNIYETTGTVELFANKKLTGRDLEDGKFKFILRDEKGGLVSEALNPAAKAGEIAKAEFPVITYTQEDLNATASHLIDDAKGIYAKYYTVREFIPDNAEKQNDGTYKFEGYTYDAGVYNVVVTLRDNGKGKIDTDWYAFKTGLPTETPSTWEMVKEFFRGIFGKSVYKNALFENEYEAKGAIELSAKKILTGKDLKAEEFKFQLIGDHEGGKVLNIVALNDAQGNVDFGRLDYTEAGYYELTIQELIPKEAQKENGVWVLNGIKYDATVYTVKVTVSDPGDGKLVVSATIEADAAGYPKTTMAKVVNENGEDISLCKPESVEFKNNYECKPISIVLGGDKTLIGRDLLNEDEFSFTLKSADDNPKKLEETVNINRGINGPNGEFSFSEIEFTFDDMLENGKYLADKTFDYVIAEVIPDTAEKKENGTYVLDGVTYDTHNYDISIKVTNSDGILDAKITKDGTTKVDNSLKAVRFTNVYNTSDSLVLPIEKLVIGTDDDETAFEFELTGTDIATPMTVTAYNGQTVYFAPIKYTLDGIKNPDGTYGKTYTYTVKELPGTAKGYSYSEEVYTVSVDVTSDGKSGKIDISTPQITINKAAYDEFAMKFTNHYNATGHTDIDGTKELVGRKLKDGEFEFALSKKDDIPDANGEYKYSVIDTAVNVNGKFSFGLDYDQNDIGKTYYYTVNEIIPSVSENTVSSNNVKVDYDKSVYDITVTVEDNGDGTLKVHNDPRKGTAAVTSCDFKNTEVKPNQIVFDAKKTLKGKALEGSTFTFTLTGDGQNQSVTNTGEYIKFEPIYYDLDDVGKTFTYTIKELGKSGDGITYDATQYIATVKVTGVDTDGNLIIEDEIRKNNNIVKEITFENIYTSSVSVEIGGHKFLEGFTDGVTPLGTYTFELLDKNGKTVQLDKNGKIVSDGGKKQLVTVTPKKATDSTEYSFDKITFDQDDMLASMANGNTFTYKVKEVVPVLEERSHNVKYAENEYNVNIVLYYDNNGILQAQTSTTEGVGLKDLDFTNKYEAEGSIILDGIKTITGKELENASYSFHLEGEGQDQTVTNNGSVFTFKAIQYEPKDLGIHKYTITETASKDGSEIDHTVYTVEVNVGEGDDGKLEVTRDVYRKAEDGTVVNLGADGIIAFNNKFRASGQVDIEGLKIMHNKPLKAGDFKFILKDNATKEIIDTVSSNAAPLNNKDDLEAQAAFKFKPITFTQEDLKSANGKSYLSEVKKYYTVYEENTGKGGVTYSDAEYLIEVTIKSNGTENLDVTKKIALKNKSGVYENEKTDIIDSLKLLFADDSKLEHQIIFENTYDSECIIDPPILRKQIFGKTIERGEFSFKIEGPGLKSMGEEKTGYVRTVKNGVNPVDGSKYYSDGKEIPLSEIYVGDIKYKYTDLDIDLETGEASREFVYRATEIPGTDKSVEYSPQVFQLTVKVVDDNEGHMYTIPPISGMKWEPLTPFVLSDEQMEDTFVNTWPGEGSINIVGIKRMEGRKISKDDKFEFTLTDDKTGASVTRTTTEDENGVPRKIAFNAVDKNGNVDVDFLNYKVDLVAGEGVSANHIPVDDTGLHTYTITEKAGNQAGIKYDTASFKVYVDVQPEKDANGNYVYNPNGHVKLGAKVVDVEKIYSDNNKVKFDFAGNSQFEFVNEFKATGHVEFTGSKVVNDPLGKDAGLAGSLKDKYNFAIYQYTDEARTQGKNLIDVKSTDASGKFTLSVPEYDQDVLKNDKGEYEESKTLYYRIIETKPSNGSWTENNTVFESEGIIYDNTEYDVDVTVTYDGTPELKVSKNVKKAGSGQAISGIIFTNVESVEYTDVKGTKTWIDNVKDASTRPDVVVSLYSSAVGGGKKVINTYTIKAPALTYEFSTDAAGDPLPKYDSNGKNIKYTVAEAPITGYLSEQKGYDFFNTKGTIKIQKIDADTNEPLAGATLAIYDGKTLVEKWTTGNSAHVVEKDLTPGKTYTLRETAAPDGYDLAADISFTVPADGSDITVTMSDKPIIGSVRLTKLDSETRKTLAGAEFSLYTNEGTRIYATGTAGKYSVKNTTSNGVFATSSAGTLEITDLPKGTYYFVETKAPEGYILSSEKLSFTIADSKALIEVSFLNKQSVASVKLRKVGSTGTRGLEGAEFELYAKTPRTSSQAISSTIYPNGYYRYGTYKTDSSGEIKVTDLPWDEYYFVETKAPEGYTIAKDIGGETLAYTFTVDAANAGSTIDLGDIVNNPEEIETGVLGERIPPEEKQSGVLGVRSAPKKGVLGTRVGPATGDASAIALWLTLLVACVGTIIWMLASKRRKSLGKQ